MSKIHYFQRYSSVENTVTNNTLQLISRIYSYSSNRASAFLSELTGESIEIGIEVNQQKKGIDSVPDGSIIQRSFKVLIESKVDSYVNVSQLIKHAGCFGAEENRVLLLLTKEKIDKSTENDIRKKINEKYDAIVFQNITYEDICNATDGLFQEYESDMCALVADYVEYCNDANLFDQSRFLMRVVPCGQSVHINKKHGVYFHPSDRGYSNHKYLGIYADKSVQALWDIESIFDVDFDGTDLKKVIVSGSNTGLYDKNIIDIIQDAKTECGYNIANGHRFFCGKAILTNYKKSSSGGIQNARLINLKNVIGELGSVEDIASKLNGFT